MAPLSVLARERQLVLEYQELTIAALNVLGPEEVWGAHAVLEGEPSFKVYENVVFDPGMWGLFDGHGDIIMDSAFRRGAEGALVRAKPKTMLDRAHLPVLDQEVVYMGGLRDHFGHFICTSLSRMWAWRRFSDKQFVFHGCSYDVVREMQVARLCLDHFQVEAARVLQPAQPCLLKRVIVPASAFDEQRQAYTAFRDACLDVGSGLVGKSGEAVYLSKTRLLAGVQRIVNEADLEEELAALGVEIVYPERLSIEAQIALFSSGRTVLGAVGSAFHTHVFVPRCGTIVCLQPFGPLNSNYVLFDKLASAPALYVTPAVPSTMVGGGAAGFPTQYELADPRGVARDMLKLA